MSQWRTSCLRALFCQNANISWNTERNLVRFIQNDLKVEYFQIYDRRRLLLLEIAKP